MFRSADAPDPASWRSYVEEFHRQRPGITERILEQCRDETGSTPYRCVAAPLDPHASVLDLACGSGPLHSLVTGRWVGIDISPAELAAATARGAAPLVAGDAARLPFGSASFDAVVCSMALMVVQPLARVLAEIARVLRPGGRLVALLPSTHPLTLADRLRYARLLVALRRVRFAYPHDVTAADFRELLVGAVLAPVDDRHRRFTYPFATGDAARELVASLYLPGTGAARIAAAERVAERWVGKVLGVPLQLVVARRADQ